MLKAKDIFSAEWKKANKGLYAIMREIFLSPGVSRQEISQRLDVTKAAVTNSVDKLSALGIVEEGDSTESARGRKPVSLCFRHDLFFTVGVSFHNGDIISVCLSDANGKTLSSRAVKVDFNSPLQKCGAAIQMINSGLTEAKINPEDITGVGVSFTGIVNPDTGEIVSSSQFSKGVSFSLSKYFTEKLKSPVTLINMSHLLPLVEKRRGKAKTMKSFLYLDSRYGLGMFLNGRLYIGHQEHAGEAGFMQLSDRGECGDDGRTGLWGDLGAIQRVTQRLDTIIAANGNTRVRQYITPASPEVTIEMVVRAVKEGDALCAELFGHVFQTTAAGVLNLAYIFNPEAIFLEPWTAECPECTIDIVRRRMSHYGVQHWGLKTEVLSAARGRDSLAEGAASLPLYKFFEEI